MLPSDFRRPTLKGDTMPVSLAVPTMAKKAEPVEYCSYTTVGIDTEVYFVAKAAAALAGNQTVREYISDLVNARAAADIGRPPVKRKPAPPKPKGKGRPRTKS